MRPRLSFIALPWGPLASAFSRCKPPNVCRHSRRRNLWGIGVGWLMLRLRRWVNEHPLIEIVLSILTPFSRTACRRRKGR